MSPLRLADGVLRAELEGEEVLLNPETGEYHLLNVTGRAALVLLEQGFDVEATADQLAAEYGRDRDDVMADVQRFVNDMRSRQLLLETS